MRKEYFTLDQALDAVLESEDDCEHDIVILPPEPTGNVTDEEGCEDDITSSNNPNDNLPNDVAGTLELQRKSVDSDNEIESENETLEPQPKKKKPEQVKWKLDLFEFTRSIVTNILKNGKVVTQDKREKEYQTKLKAYIM